MTESIKLDPSKSQRFEFEIKIAGLTTNNPTVKFAITNVFGGELVFACTHVKTAKHWYVDIPILKCLNGTKETHQFKIHVVADDYYFEPASGDIEIATMKKPVVTAAISEDVTTLTVYNVTNHDAPNNTLLTPETNPEFEPNDQFSITTNKGENLIDNEVKLSDTEHEDTPSEIADRIVKETLGGKAKKPAFAGYLFKKVDPKLKQQQSDTTKKVKNMLKDMH